MFPKWNNTWHIDLQAFVGALRNPDGGLTYDALTGKCKHSIPDCETIFSCGVLNYLQQHSHEAEAMLVKTVY